MNLSLKRLNLRKQCSTVEFPMKNTNILFLFETYVFAGKQETWIPLSVMPLLFPVLLVSLSVFILFVLFFLVLVFLHLPCATLCDTCIFSIKIMIRTDVQEKPKRPCPICNIEVVVFLECYKSP